jgi:Zn-dependent protease
MFGMRWRILRVWGIPISIDVTWLILLALMTFSFTELFPRLLQQFFPGAPLDLGAGTYWIMGFVTALGLFTCILLHELGHAVVARAGGMPIRGITLFMFGGVAELGGEPESASGEFLMAIAGPAVSVILAVVLGLSAWIGAHAGWPHPIVMVVGYLSFLNLMLLAFNLVPAFPLDGGRVLRSLIWAASGNLRSATYATAMIGQIFAGLLIALGLLQFLVGIWIGGLWMCLIGWFLLNAARTGYHQVLIRQALEGEPVSVFMNRDLIVVPPAIDLRDWVHDYVYRHHHQTYPVVSEGHLEGLIDMRVLNRIPPDEWRQHTVGEVMRHDLDRMTVSPDADGLQVLERIQRAPAYRLLVADGDHLVGMVGIRDLLEFVNLKTQVEGGRRNGSNGSLDERELTRRD